MSPHTESHAPLYSSSLPFQRWVIIRCTSCALSDSRARKHSSDGVVSGKGNNGLVEDVYALDDLPPSVRQERPVCSQPDAKGCLSPHWRIGAHRHQLAIVHRQLGLEPH